VTTATQSNLKNLWLTHTNRDRTIKTRFLPAHGSVLPWILDIPCWLLDIEKEWDKTKIVYITLIYKELGAGSACNF